MAQGKQSKEGLYDMLFDELKRNGFSGPVANQVAVAIIDNILTDAIRENRIALAEFLQFVGITMMVCAINLKKPN